jgi:thiamine biosynthesis lipoprotein
MKNSIRYVVIVGTVIVLLYFMYTRMTEPGSVEFDSGSRVMMGTFSRVVVLADSERTARQCVEAAFEVQRRIEELMSYHREDSELSKVNREAAEKPVAVDPMTFEVLQKSVQFSELTNGVFDVTVGPLVDLWKAAGQTNTPPTEEALAEARAKVGYKKLILDETNRTVRFAVAGMKVDLGGIAKGYAVDQSVEAMQQRGAAGGMVDLGGNIRCFGRPPRGQAYWRIGLQDPNVSPDDLNAKPLLVLAITDQSVATSGGYRRFTTVSGARQSHIIDAATGRSAAKLASDTIIAADATAADALSTAVNVLGPDAGLALIERLPDTEAILIPAGKGAKPLFSAGAKAYVVPGRDFATKPGHGGL